MTALICALAIAVTPPAACEHGGHATLDSSYERGGHALALAPAEPVGDVNAWLCIHRHEGAWDDRGDPYWGGLQMDRSFMRAYGRDMLQRHHGGLADTWTPREQMVVAERARRSRGYAPWPRTARMCGVLS